MTKRSFIHAVKPFLFGCITGIIGGIVTSLFSVCAKIVSAYSLGLYDAARRGALGIMCVAMLVLVTCLVAAQIQTFFPRSKGSGVPLTEGCARGIFRVKWLRTAAALIGGSTLSFLCGVPLGSEGPSIAGGGLIGGSVGETKPARRDPELQRYLITGGASAGLAVAFNAPLTGVAFALEETHRRFSPGILLAAFSAVVPAVLVSQLIFWGFGHIPYLAAAGVSAGAAILPSFIQNGFDDAGIFFAVCGIAAVCGALAAAVGIAFNRLSFLFGKLFSRVRNSALRLLPIFTLTVICGLILPTSIGSGEAALHSASTSTATWLLFILFAVRFVLPVLASGAGATGGLFLPMIAIGGLFGLRASKLCVYIGLPEAYVGNIVMLCVAAFFAASVRAPISAIFMAVELTASFSNLLPCAIAVAVATAIGGLTRTAPLYERMMEDMAQSASPDSRAADLVLVGTVSAASALCGKRIRDILWPYNSLVTELVREDGTVIVPDGETVVLNGDKLTVRADDVIADEFISRIQDYLIIPQSTEKMRN